jgi:membrane-associated phospholipid phosphatase
MLRDARRGLSISGALLTGALALGTLEVWSTTHPVVQAVDDGVWRLAGVLRNRPTTVTAVGLSWAGSVWVNWPLRAFAAAVLVRRREWMRLIALGLAVITSEVIIGPVKALLDRPRPPGSLITTSAASFPSGHAVATAVTAVGLVLVLARPGPSRWAWEVRAVTFSAVMAASRVYLRAHWLSDTVVGGLAGAGLALGWPALLIVAAERWPHRQKRPLGRGPTH